MAPRECGEYKLRIDFVVKRQRPAEADPTALAHSATISFFSYRVRARRGPSGLPGNSEAPATAIRQAWDFKAAAFPRRCTALCKDLRVLAVSHRLSLSTIEPNARCFNDDPLGIAQRLTLVRVVDCNLSVFSPDAPHRLWREACDTRLRAPPIALLWSPYQEKQYASVPMVSTFC